MNVPREWISLLRRGVPPVRRNEWLAIYNENDEELPGLVFKATTAQQGLIEGESIKLSRPSLVTCYTVGKQTRALHVDSALTDFMRTNEGAQGTSLQPPNLAATTGVLWKARVVPLTKGEKETKKTTLLFYGPLSRLTMDPKWFGWSDGSQLHDYSAKKGRTFL